jgi:hypothetical protein
VTAFTVGADGRFLFDNLLPSDYVVRVTPPEGYRVTVGNADPNVDNSMLDNNCSAVDGNFQTQAISLLGGTEPAVDVDGDDSNHNMTIACGFWRSTGLGGRLWVDVDMDGKQGKGELNLPGLEVKLTDSTGQPVNNLHGEVVEPVKTDDKGEYFFGKLKAGKYIVMAQKPQAYRPTIGVEAVNNDDDTDSNGFTEQGSYIASTEVDLSWNNEPTNDGDDDPSTNLTVDFGFIPMLAIPTVSQWGLILMSFFLMLAGMYWQRRKN